MNQPLPLTDKNVTTVLKRIGIDMSMDPLEGATPGHEDFLASARSEQGEEHARTGNQPAAR